MEQHRNYYLFEKLVRKEVLRNPSIFNHDGKLGWTNVQIISLEDSLLSIYFDSAKLLDLKEGNDNFYELYFDKKNQKVKIDRREATHPIISKDLSGRILNQKLNDFNRLKIESSIVSEKGPTTIQLKNIKGKRRGVFVQEDYLNYLNNNAFSFDSSSQLYLLNLYKKQKVICSISSEKDKLYGMVALLNTEE